MSVEKINVLFISHSSELNGAERMLLQVLEKIDRSRFNPFLILPRVGLLAEEMERLGIENEVVSMKWWITEKSCLWKQPLSWIYNLKSILYLKKYIKRKNISLVVSNSSAVSSGALAASLSRVPHLWIIHEILSGKKAQLHFFLGERALLRFISKLSKIILVNSRLTQKAFRGKGRVYLMYNGFEVKPQMDDYRKNMRKELNLKEGEFVLGIVGKIAREKGQAEVIRAFKLLNSKFPQIKLLIVGSIKSKSYYHHLLKMITEFRLERRIIFTGFKRDILSILSAMDLLVVASENESFGRVAAEAMSVGTAVVAVRAGGLSEVIEEGEDGFLVNSSRPEEIAEAIEYLIRNPRELAKIAENGKRTVQEKFSLKKQVKLLQEAMEECLG